MICVVLATLVTGVILLGTGLSAANHYVDVPCALLNVTNCVQLCKEVDDDSDPYPYFGNKKRHTHTVCSGAAFLCDAQYNYANESHVVRAVNATWIGVAYNCSTVVANAPCVAVVSVDSPGNVTGVYRSGFVSSRADLICGAVILGLFVLVFCGGAICHVFARKNKSYTSV